MEPQLNARYSDYLAEGLNFRCAMPKNLLVDEVVRIGRGALSAVNETNYKTEQRGNG